jgi:ADP-heptose:LPS heptosyltransferase
MAELLTKNYKKKTLTIKEFYERKNKVLIWHDKGGLGDVFMQRMIFDDLKRECPECEFTLACLPEYRDAAIDHPYIHDVVDSRTVNHEDYICVLNTCVTIADRYEHHKAPNYDDHRSDIWARYCGLNLTSHDMHFVIDQDRKRSVMSRIQSLKKNSGALIGFSPTSKIATKSLQENQIGWIANKLNEHNLIAFHKDELSSCKRHGIQTLSGLGLQDFICYVDCMDYMITVDTAAFHLAGGLRKPLCGIFTFADGKVYGKHYDFTLVQKHRDNGNWECGPCFKFGNCIKSRKQLKPCLTEITETEIISGIDEMFKKCPFKSEKT